MQLSLQDMRNLLVKYRMNCQEVVLDMANGYPFDSLDLPVSGPRRIFVRRIVPYSPSNYSSLKAKFAFARRITNKTVVKLTRVMQEQGLFHLLYEYIPHHISTNLRSLTPDCLDRLKTELILLSAYLNESKLVTELSANYLGVDSNMQFRYYLDIDFTFNTERSANLQNSYITQINRLCRGLARKVEEIGKGNSGPADPNGIIGSGVRFPVSPISPKGSSTQNLWADNSSQFIMPERQKSVTSQQTIKPPLKITNRETNNPIELLQNIEAKIGRLKNSLKRFTIESEPTKISKISGKSRQCNKQSDANEADSTKQKILNQQRKVQPRSPLSPSPLHSPYSPLSSYSPRSLRNREANLSPTADNLELGDEDNKKQTDKINQFHLHSKLNNWMFCNSDASSMNSKNDPKNKVDLDELKKQQFQQISNHKQKYVRQFLNILKDESKRKKKPAEKPSETPPKPVSKISNTSSNGGTDRPNQTDLQRRVRLAIKQTDQALIRFQKFPGVTMKLLAMTKQKPLG